MIDIEAKFAPYRSLARELLTTPGLKLLDHANRILADMAEARADLVGYIAVET